MNSDSMWTTHEELIRLLPSYSKIKISSEVDRYGFSSELAKRVGRRSAPRSFANWVHGWIWSEKPTSENLGCFKLPKDLIVVVRNKVEKNALEAEGFLDARIGGLPFAYIEKQHNNRHANALLAYPPHSSEAEVVTRDQTEYLDYLYSIKCDFEFVYLSVYYLDLGGPFHMAADKRGFKILQGARPDDANSLRRVRSMLDSFAYVTSNVMGSHMLYALFSGCKFSFCGPMYSYDGSEFEAKGNPHGFSVEYIRRVIQFQSESYLRERFVKFFVAHPSKGLVDAIFASDTIGEKFLMNSQQITDALGWNLSGQMNGYLSGALRRTSRFLRA